MQTVPCFSCNDSGKCKCPTCGGCGISPMGVLRGATHPCSTCYGDGKVRCYTCKY